MNPANYKVEEAVKNRIEKQKIKNITHEPKMEFLIFLLQLPPALRP